MNKIYILEVLYDNGKQDSFDISNLDSEVIEDIKVGIYNSFTNGTQGVLNLPIGNTHIFINISKTSCINIKEKVKIGGKLVE